VKRFRGGLVFKAHRLVYRSTLGLRVIKKKKNHQGLVRLDAKEFSDHVRGEVFLLDHVRAPVQGYLAHKKTPPPGRGILAGPRRRTCRGTSLIRKRTLLGEVLLLDHVRAPGKGNSNSHGARPVHQIITMIKWIRTSRLSIKNSLSRRTCRTVV